MSSKRPPTSPIFNMNKKEKFNPHETSKDKIIKVEFDTINGKPYFGQISEEELLFVWISVFKKPRELLFGIKSTKSLTRNVRATFKLTASVKLQEEFPNEHFSYENFLDDGQVEKVTGRILGYKKKAEIGQITKITITTNFGVEPPGILNWLQRYGTVSAKYNFVQNPETGVFTDVFETEICLNRHIPEYLPMYGQKVSVEYPGIEKVCNRCYTPGHMRRECGNSPREWIKFVIDFIKEENIPSELIGSWENAIERYHNANK